MKRNITIFAAMALAAATLLSCAQQFDERGPQTGKASRLLFEGGFDATRTAFGTAEDGVYQLTWSKGDAIGIFSFDQAETVNENMKAELLDASAGMASGLFAPVDNLITIPAEVEGADPVTIVETITYPQQNDEQFFIYYPWKSGTTINVETAAVHGTLASRQFQDALGDKKIGPNGFSTAMASVKAGTNKVSFTLTHRMAYVCFKATSTEFSDYQLHAVQLFDMKKEAVLAGDWSFSPVSGELSKGATGNYSASVEISEHNYNAAPAANELYLTVLPGDYSAAEMWVSVTFMRQDGQTVTIPKRFEKDCKFPAGTLTTIDLGDLKSSDVSFAWYEPVEKRDLVGYYAYGHVNTYYAVRLERPGSELVCTPVHIDAKARGDFSRVREPKYYALVTPSEMGCRSVKDGVRRFLSLDEDANSAAVRREAVPTHEIGPDYSFDVYVPDQTLATGRWGTVGIYDKDYNLLWSFMVIGYLPDDPPRDIVYPEGFTLMDRYLGQARGPVKAAENTDGKMFDNPPCAYFQWGRKDPLTWTNTDGLAFYTVSTADENTSIETAIQNPTTVYVYDEASGRKTWGDWQQADGQRNDLWGGYNNTDKEWYDPEEKGHKTIFDPCPDGYRVPDAKVFKTVSEKALTWESTNKSDLQVRDAAAEGYYLNPKSPWFSASSGKGETVLAVPVAGAPFVYSEDGNSYDIWPWGGFLYGAGSYTKRSGTNCDYNLEVWSNAFCNSDQKQHGRAACLEYGYWSTVIYRNDRHSAIKAQRNSVRCQKED